MPISCEDLALQMAELEIDKLAVEELIAEIQAAIGNTTDPEVMMGLMMDLSAAYTLQSEINSDITIVYWNQILLGCIPDPMMGAVAAKQADPLVMHERLRKLQVKRFKRIAKL
jgi:hypothetical protein